jgi:hypothetical protein
MTQPPDETPDFLAKPVSPSGDQPSPPGPPEPPSPAYGAPGYGYTPYAPGPGMAGYPFAQAHNGANVAMGLGIASVVCAVLTPFVCITLPGVLTGPFAIALAVRARKEMSQSPGLYNNAGAAMTGLVTGIIGTVVGLAIVALGVFFFTALLSLR